MQFLSTIQNSEVSKDQNNVLITLWYVAVLYLSAFYGSYSLQAGCILFTFTLILTITDHHDPFTWPQSTQLCLT